MVRTSKLVVALVVVLGSVGILAAYTGNAEPYVSQSALPGPPPVGMAAADPVTDDATR